MRSSTPPADDRVMTNIKLVLQDSQRGGRKPTSGAAQSGPGGGTTSETMTRFSCPRQWGTMSTWYVSAAVKSFLFQVEPTDPRIFAGALLVLALAGLAASAVPARRAASVDPLVALRRE